MTEPHAGPPLGPEYTGVHTLVLQEDHQLACIDTAIWPPAGAVIELGNPNREVVVKDVRLRLYSVGGDHGCWIVIEVQDQVVDAAERLLRENPT
jgi:hypothetical protein